MFPYNMSILCKITFPDQKYLSQKWSCMVWFWLNMIYKGSTNKFAEGRVQIIVPNLVWNCMTIQLWLISVTQGQHKNETTNKCRNPKGCQICFRFRLTKHVSMQILHNPQSKFKWKSKYMRIEKKSILFCYRE